MIIRRKTRSTIHVLVVPPIALLALASLLTAWSASASVVPGVLSDAPPDSLLTLIPSRTEETARQDLAEAEAMEAEANADLVSAQGCLGEAKGHVDVRKSEIESIEAKIKSAKEQKNETEQANLEQQAKAKALQLKVLEARKEMRDAEVSFIGALRKLAQAKAGYFRKELELIGTRDNLLRMSSAHEGATNLEGLIQLQVEIRELERRCLDILKDVAEEEENTAQDEARLLDKRLKLHEAQLALLGGKKK